MNCYLNPQRFDVIAKYIYVKFYKMNLNTNFHVKLYQDHIYIFNGGYENPGKKKNVNDFVTAFNELIESFEKNKYLPEYPIPVGKDNVIINGAHRLSLCLYYGINPIMKPLPKNGPKYNYNFFLHRKKSKTKYKNGLPLKNLDINHSDYMALEYSQIQPKTRVMIIFPNVNFNKMKDQIMKIIQSYGGSIFYLKEMSLSKKGLKNLICELYRGEKWIGGLFPTKPESKTNLCWGPHKTIALLIQFEDLNKVVECKGKFRELCKSRHSCHVNDTPEETIRISRTVFNNNSIDFLNKAGSLSPKGQKTLKKYFELVALNQDYFVVDSSFILEMYGIRQANDLDYISYQNTTFPSHKNIELHTDRWIKYYSKEKDDLLFNPINHFYFNGFKFLTLNLVKQMKINRNESKDQKDVELITKC